MSTAPADPFQKAWSSVLNLFNVETAEDKYSKLKQQFDELDEKERREEERKQEVAQEAQSEDTLERVVNRITVAMQADEERERRVSVTKANEAAAEEERVRNRSLADAAMEEERSRRISKTVALKSRAARASAAEAAVSAALQRVDELDAAKVEADKVAASRTQNARRGRSLMSLLPFIILLGTLIANGVVLVVLPAILPGAGAIRNEAFRQAAVALGLSSMPPPPPPPPAPLPGPWLNPLVSLQRTLQKLRPTPLRTLQKLLRSAPAEPEERCFADLMRE